MTSRSHHARCALILLGAVALLGCNSEPPAPTLADGSPAARNVVLITVDTLRADHLGHLGWQRDTSPWLDVLAQEGAVFTQTEAQWPKTGQSMTSLMTSNYAAVHGVRELHMNIDDRLLMVGEVLKDAGFYNASFISNVNIGPYFNFPQGFDEAHEMWDTSKGPRKGNQGTTFVPTSEIADRVVAWLKQPRDERFFLWVHLLDPHGPYLPPDDVADRFVGDELHRQQARPVSSKRVARYQLVGGHETLGDYVAAYDAEILDVDRSIARILQTIDEAGKTDESLVIVTADHGESLGEHDYYFEHGKYTYEACTHVPLMMRFPGHVPPGLRVDTPVPLIDVAPTILELTAVPWGEAESRFQGRSLGPFFNGVDRPGQPIFIEAGKGQRAVREGKWKYHHDPRRSARNAPEKLFNIDADPRETRNLLKQEAAVARRLRGLLDAWSREMENRRMHFENESVSPDKMDPATREQLESLGYLQ